MKIVSGFIYLIMFLAMIAVIIYGGYYVFQITWGYYLELEFIVRTVLLSAMVSLLIASMIIATSIKSSAKTAANAPIMAEKLSLYKRLVEISLSSSNLVEQFNKLRPDVVLLASNAVIEVYEKLVLIDSSDDTSRSKLEGLCSQLVKSIRLDLGQKNTIGTLKNWRMANNKHDVEPGVTQSL